ATGRPRRVRVAAPSRSAVSGGSHRYGRSTAGTCPRGGFRPWKAAALSRTDSLRAAADVDDLAAHVRCVVRAEERDHARDVLRLPDLLQRRLLRGVLLEIVEVDADALGGLARHRSRDEARR